MMKHVLRIYVFIVDDVDGLEMKHMFQVHVVFVVNIIVIIVLINTVLIVVKMGGMTEVLVKRERVNVNIVIEDYVPNVLHTMMVSVLIVMKNFRRKINKNHLFSI